MSINGFRKLLRVCTGGFYIFDKKGLKTPAPLIKIKQIIYIFREVQRKSLIFQGKEAKSTCKTICGIIESTDLMSYLVEKAVNLVRLSL
jgi:hypothetical protein